MAKDPAFLFYPSDFLTGSMFMSNEDAGIYIRLLCAQHQHGGIIDKVSFSAMVGSRELLRSKFKETEDGFYNERLMDEMIKRAKKSENLSDNAKKMWYIRKQKQCKSNANASDLHMPTVNVNEDRDVVVKKSFTVPTIKEIKEYCSERKNFVDPERFFNFYESKGWMVGKNKMKDWKAAVRNWEKINTEHNSIEIAKSAGADTEQPRMTARETPRNVAKETDEYLKKLREGQPEGV